MFIRGGQPLEVTAVGRELTPCAEQAVTAAEGEARTVRTLGALGGGTASCGLLRNADHYAPAGLIQPF